jgi:hypothetical protein
MENPVSLPPPSLLTPVFSFLCTPSHVLFPPLLAPRHGPTLDVANPDIAIQRIPLIDPSFATYVKYEDSPTSRTLQTFVLSAFMIPNRSGRSPLHMAADPPTATMTEGHVVRPAVPLPLLMVCCCNL